MRLPAGPVKRIYIDRTAAAAGEPAWAIRVDAELAGIPGFTVVRARVAL